MSLFLSFKGLGQISAIQKVILALNISTTIFIFLIASAVIIASFNLKDKLFYIRAAILLIPVVAQIRQILAANNQLSEYPLFIFLVYLLLRCVGPLLNWHTHIQINRPIRYLSIINIVTYCLLGYVVFDFFYALTLGPIERAEYVLSNFENPGWFSFTYPVVQLLHVLQAVYFINKSKKARHPSNGLYFIRVGLYTIVFMLIFLQIGYFFFERPFVELILAPLIFLIIYSVILFVSIRYSSIHNKAVNMVGSPRLKQIESLSDRENQVLSLIATGKTDKEIGEEIHVSANTVRTYVSRIYSKLDLKNRTEAANFYNRAS